MTAGLAVVGARQVPRYPWCGLPLDNATASVGAMPSMPAQVTNTTYRKMADALQHAAGLANGYVTVPDPNNANASDALPALKNMHAVAIFQALRRAAARGAESWGLGDWEWLWFAFGWRNAGDKFIDTKAQADGQYLSDSPDMLSDFWFWVDKTCDELDALHTVVRPLYMTYTFAAYGQAERDGWERMKQLQPAAAPAAPQEAYIMPGDVTPPGDILPTVPLVPKVPLAGKAFAFLVLVALVLGTSKRRKR